MVNVTNAPYPSPSPTPSQKPPWHAGSPALFWEMIFSSAAQREDDGYVERLCLSVSWRPEPSCVADRVFSPSVTSSRQTDHSHRPLCVCVSVKTVGK